MKSIKTKLHQHRKAKGGAHRAAIAHDVAEIAHEVTDLEMQLYRIERSPKQENL